MDRRANLLLVALATCLILLISGCGLFDSDGGADSGGSSLLPFSSESAGSSVVSTGVNDSYDFRQEEVVIDAVTGEHYVAGVVLVYFSPSASQQERDDAVALAGGEVIGQMDAFDEYQLRVSASDRQELEELCDRLEAAPGVDVASLDHVVATGAETLLPADPWGGAGFGGSDNSWWAQAVDAPEAWYYYDSLGLTPATVAVIDNGFDMDHEDLSSRLGRVSGADGTNRNERDHGTHVAGIVGAAANNGRGISGLLWSGQVLCFDASPGTGSEGQDSLSDTYLEQGLLESVQAGAKVLNYSNGGSRAKTAEKWQREHSDADSAGRLYSRRVGALLAKGYDFVVVQSAGNGDADYQGIDAFYNREFASINASNCDTTYVSSSEILDRVIVVGAAERIGGSYRLTSFSNGGSRVDVCAPGQDIYSSVVDGYDTLSGTSMAAPIVAGTAALVWGADSGLSGREVKQLVCGSVNDHASSYPGALYGSGSYPLVNAGRAVGDALERAGISVEPADQADQALLAFEQYLRDLHARGWVEGETLVMSAEDGETDTYYEFAVGDFDGDGTNELFVCHELTGEYGNSFGCVNEVIEYSELTGGPSTSRVCITTFVPDGLGSAGTGWLSLHSDYQTADNRTYMPMNDQLAQGYDLRDTNYLSIEELGGSWHLLSCSAFAVDGDQQIDRAERDRLVSLFEGSGTANVPLQPMTEEAIATVCPTV